LIAVGLGVFFHPFILSPKWTWHSYGTLVQHGSHLPNLKGAYWTTIISIYWYWGWVRS